ncbi:MAG: PTS sugar transporter subunit IIC [Culicoidibacterales bacterium]
MNFLDKIAEKLLPVAGKLSSQRHLAAIRDSFIEMMPLVIIGSFMVLINNVFLSSNPGGLFSLFPDPKSFEPILAEIRPIFGLVYNGTLNIISLLIAFAVAYKLAQSYGEKPLYFGLLAVGTLIIMFPQATEFTVTVKGLEEVVKVGGVITGTQTSAVGLFMAFFTGIIATELLRAFTKIKAILIKMPESVPPAVAKSFNVLVPSFLVILLFALLAYFLDLMFGLTLQDVINTVIQAPVSQALESYIGIAVVMLLQNGLWSFGIHGAFALSPVVEPALLIAIEANAKAFEAGLVLPNIVTKPFIDAFVLIGGGGTTIGLLGAVLIASKREDYRAVTNFSVMPGVFNINEPLIFGLPVVLNPILMIPLILAPLACLTVAYVATAVGLVSKTFILVPWTTPPVLSAFLATGGDWRAAVLAIILILLAIAIYIPFVIVANKAKDIEGAATTE